MNLRNVAVLAWCFLLMPVGAGASSEIPRAVTLTGETVEATGELLGARALLVVNFRPSANGSAREWRRVLDDDSRLAGWSVYNVVVLDGAPKFVQRLAVRALRGEVPPERRDSYLVVEEGAGAWRELVGSNGEEEGGADAVFVARLEDGSVCGRYRGLVSAQALDELLEARCGGPE